MSLDPQTKSKIAELLREADADAREHHRLRTTTAGLPPADVTTRLIQRDEVAEQRVAKLHEVIALLVKALG